VLLWLVFCSLSTAKLKISMEGRLRVVLHALLYIFIEIEMKMAVGNFGRRLSCLSW
jgi:hypothetical protein